MNTYHFRQFVTLTAVVLLLAAMLLSAPAPVSAQTGCTDSVRYGDTLYSIALRHNTTFYYLAQLNGLYNPNLIYAGMALSVPCTSSGDVPAPSGICNYYTVAWGDYLKTIAARFGTTWQAIAQANRLYNPNYIYAGMRLAIPCGTTPPPPDGSSYVSALYHYAVKTPTGWAFKVNTSVPGGAGSNPEYVTFSAPGSSLPRIDIQILTGTPPITGFENCDKNLIFRGLPACSLAMPAGQIPAQHMLIFQKGNAFFHIVLQYDNDSALAIWTSFLMSFEFQ